MKFQLSQMAQVIGGKLTGDCEFSGFCIDSRSVLAGELFLCLKGARVDGHDYAAKAVQSGACGVLAERLTDAPVPHLIVPSVLDAIQKYSSWYRSQKDVWVVGVTGSVGKTTTKEYISAVLSQKYPTYKTPGNQNSEIGLPLTLLHIEETHRAAVIEMGMSGLGEISVLSRLARPKIGVITNIGLSHIEFLGSQENILKAKLEILEGMASDGFLVLNGDDVFLSQVSVPGRKIYTYGLGNPSFDFYADRVAALPQGTSFTAKTPMGNIDILLSMDGIHNVYNALAAVAVGILSGVEPERIAKGLREMENAPLRQNIYEKDGLTIIEDCYNASPASMTAALDVLKGKPGRKVVVLGDMLELGDLASELHRQVGEQLNGVSVLICYGKHTADYIEGAQKAHVLQCIPCENTEKAALNLKLVARKGDVILFKASRGMHAEEVIEHFFQDR